MEHLRKSERQDDHADHLHHRGKPERPIIGVVRRCEPREVNPCPANREDCQDKGREAGGKMAFGEQVRKLLAGHSKRHDKGEVIQQLQRRCRPVPLIRIAA